MQGTSSVLWPAATKLATYLCDGDDGRPGAPGGRPWAALSVLEVGAGLGLVGALVARKHGVCYASNLLISRIANSCTTSWAFWTVLRCSLRGLGCKSGAHGLWCGRALAEAKPGDKFDKCSV